MSSLGVGLMGAIREHGCLLLILLVVVVPWMFAVSIVEALLDAVCRKKVRVPPPGPDRREDATRAGNPPRTTQ